METKVHWLSYLQLLQSADFEFAQPRLPFEWQENCDSFQHPISLWTLAQKYVFSFELPCTKSLVTFMTLPPAFKPFSPGKCTDRCIIRHFMFSQLSWPSPSPGSWSLGKRISRSVAKNDDNLMMIVSQSLVQFLFADQSYPKEESGLIYLISTGSFSCWGLFLPCVSVMNGAGASVNRDTSGLQFHLYLATQISTSLAIVGLCQLIQ